MTRRRGRFHGQTAKWDSNNIYECFGYGYSAEELTGWAPEIRHLARHAGTTQLLSSNRYRDQTNASSLPACSARTPEDVTDLRPGERQAHARDWRLTAAVTAIAARPPSRMRSLGRIRFILTRHEELREPSWEPSAANVRPR